MRLGGKAFSGLQKGSANQVRCPSYVSSAEVSISAAILLALFGGLFPFSIQILSPSCPARPTLSGRFGAKVP